MRRWDGTGFPVDMMFSPIETQKGRSVIAALRDTTSAVAALLEDPVSPVLQVLGAQFCEILVAFRSTRQKATVRPLQI